MRYFVFSLLLLLLAPSAAWADTITNWELGFTVEVPTTWLRYEGGKGGLKLASEDVRLEVTPFGGVTLTTQIETLRQQAKAAGYQFKEEKSYPIMEVPAHEMVFYKDGKYLLYYVLLSGQRGFLVTLRSDGTDTPAFLEAQDVVSNFRVTPLR